MLTVASATRTRAGPEKSGVGAKVAIKSWRNDNLCQPSLVMRENLMQKEAEGLDEKSDGHRTA